MANKLKDMIEDNGEKDYNKLIKDELARLQRQYRLIENQRHGYTQQSGEAAHTQNKIIGFLRAEDEDLHVDFKNANCTQYQVKAKETGVAILDILETFDKYQAEIKKQIKAIEEMEIQVDKISDRVVKHQLKMLSLYGLSRTRGQTEKKLSVNEDRLYRVRTLFDEKCSENAQLRSCINDLLINRTRFHRKHNYLKREIALVKNKMLQVVLQADHTYDARDESVTKIKSIREREHKESKQHMVEIKEFQRVLHNDHKIHEFVSVKNKERSVIEHAVARQRRKEEQKEREVDETLQKYKQRVMEILAFADFKSIDKLCSFYEKCEQSNFSKFKYTTDLNHECDALKEAIHIIKADIEMTHEAIHKRTIYQRKQLQNRQNKMFKAQEELKNLENARDEVLGKLGKLVHEVSRAFDLAGCNNSSIVGNLGMTAGVSLRNILLCINILEHQITNLNNEKAILEVRKGVELEGQSLHSYKTGMQQAGGSSHVQARGGPFYANVAIPNHLGASAEDDADAEDEKEMSSRPYYYPDMRGLVYYQMLEEGLIQRIPSTVTMPSTVGSQVSFGKKIKSEIISGLEVKGAQGQEQEQTEGQG